jgi:ferritin
MNKEILTALNKQLNREIESAYLYLSMASDCHERDLIGCAHWLELQAQEELGHVRRFYDYLIQRGERAILEGIAKPKNTWDSVQDIFEAALAHEKGISEHIHKLVALTRQHHDFATEQFLQWFVSEQVQEEANAHAVVVQLSRAKDTAALLWVDQQLGQRKLSATEAQA